MLVGAVDAVEFRRARGFGAPVVVHGCEYVRDCVQEGEGVLEFFFYGGGVDFWGIFGRREFRAGGVWKASSAKREEFENGLTASW